MSDEEKPDSPEKPRTINCDYLARVEGEGAMRISGSSRSNLSAERTSLNFLQRLSGVATLTRAFVDAAGAHPARILDTRNTTPGWRLLQ